MNKTLIISPLQSFNASMLQECSRNNLSALVFEDKREAIESFRQENPDVVILGPGVDVVSRALFQDTFWQCNRFVRIMEMSEDQIPELMQRLSV